MAVAGVLLDVAPRLASALAAHIDHLDRHLDEPVGCERLEQGPRRAIQPATGRRARHLLDLALRLPDHGLFAGLIEPSTLAQRSTSLRMNSSKAAGERCGEGATSYPRSANRLTTIGSSMATDSAWLSFATIGAGVPFGAERPYQTVSLKSGNPASVVVGTFGSIAERVSPVTA